MDKRHAPVSRTKKPNNATPITPPTCRAVFNNPDATPDCAPLTAASAASVMVGIVNAMPPPASSIGIASNPLDCVAIAGHIAR